MTSHVSKNILTRSVATLAILAAVGITPAVADPAVSGQYGDKNVVKATQDLSSTIDSSPSSVSNMAPEDATSSNGDVSYYSHTFSAPGVYTLQNQTGQNDAGNNGTNIAAQLNFDGSPSVELRHADNIVKAKQYMDSSVINGSNSSVSNYAGDFDGDSADNATSRTGDVGYRSATFGAPGVFTLQNNTGNNVAANNGSNIAAQLNDDTVDLDGRSTNAILARQDLTSMVSGSRSGVINATFDGSASSRTGNVTYASTTFDAPGVYTLANNTGLNNAGNNATNISAQLNGQTAVNALGSVLSP